MPAVANRNAKLRYLENLKNLYGDIELCEAGETSSDVLGTLRVNMEVCEQQLAQMTLELHEVATRARRLLR